MTAVLRSELVEREPLYVVAALGAAVSAGLVVLAVEVAALGVLTAGVARLLWRNRG